MGKKTAYRRRSYRRYYRRYRSVSNQYFPCRVEGVYTIAFPGDSSGTPRFYDTAGNYSYVVSFGTLFRGSQYYGSLVKMFGYYKVTGVKIEVQPHLDNAANVKQTAPILLGFRTGTVVQMTYNELVADNNSLFLGTSSNKKYVSTMNSSGWSATSDDQIVGAFSVSSPGVSTTTNAPTWACKLCVYILFKKSNV